MIRILSDLHLGHDSCRIQQVEELAPLLNGISTLLINGDGREQLARRFVSKGNEMWRDLEQLCESKRVRLVAQRGNHDPHVDGAPYRYFLDRKVIVHHGDAIYPRVSPWSREVWRHRKSIGKFVEAHWRDDFTIDERFQFAQDLELDVPQLPQPQAKNQILRALKLVAWPPHRPFLILAIWANAGRRIAGWGMQFAPQAKLIVCGHFHRSQFYQASDEKWVMVTGPFTSLGKASCVDLDETNRVASLRPVSCEKGAYWRAGDAELTLCLDDVSGLWRKQ